MITCSWNPPYFSSQGKGGAPPYSGNHWVLDQACLLIKGSKFITIRAVSNIKLNNSAYFSHSQNCKVINLELQIWHSKLLQSIMFTWAVQLICPQGTMFPLHLLLFITRNTHSSVWNGNQQREDTFISEKKQTFPHKSDSITILHFNQHSKTFLGIHLRHSTYKREKYTFINANIRVINIILKMIRDNRQTLKCKHYYYFYDTNCNSIAFLDNFRMGKTNINGLVQSIEHSLHLIHKNWFSIKQ